MKLRLVTVACILFSLILSVFILNVQSQTSPITLYAHSETTTINSVSYYLHKPESADGPATVLSASTDTAGRKLMGRWIYPLNEIAAIQPSTWTVTYRIMKSECATSVVAHGDIDILIRKSDNTIRTTIATNVANSPSLTLVGTWQTLTGTYNWPGYTVVDRTDYLEVAYYIEVTTPQTSKYVRLLIDDASLPVTDQTKTENVILAPVTKNYLTVKTDPEHIVIIPGSGWYDQDTNVDLTAPDYVDVSPGIRYKFSYWDVDGTPKEIGVNPITVTMDTNHTATAHYTLQYYLTVSSPYGTTGGEGWYDDGATAYATLNTGIVDHGNETRRVFTNWSGDTSGTNYAQSNPIIMNSPKTATANWKTQYYLEVSSAYGSPNPTSGWFDAGTSITASVTSPWPGPTGTRYVCTGWTGTGSVPPSGTANSVIFTISEPSSITWNWKTQYLLTVQTDPSGLSPQPTRNPVGEAGPANGWWYDASTSVTLTARTVTGYTFKYWGVDGVAQGAGVNPITVHMNAPHTAIAYYTRIIVPVGGYSISLTKQTPTAHIAAYTMLIALFAAALSITKRKRK